MENIDKKIEAKKKELELLELEKKEEELRLEIKKIQKTTVEENIIVRRTIYKDEYIPSYPTYPTYLPNYRFLCQAGTAINNNSDLTKLLNS